MDDALQKAALFFVNLIDGHSLTFHENEPKNRYDLYRQCLSGSKKKGWIWFKYEGINVERHCYSGTYANFFYKYVIYDDANTYIIELYIERKYRSENSPMPSGTEIKIEEAGDVSDFINEAIILKLQS